MLLSSFCMRYEDPNLDPYNGVYEGVLEEFVVSDKHWKGGELFAHVLEMEAEFANAFISLFCSVTTITLRGPPDCFIRHDVLQQRLGELRSSMVRVSPFSMTSPTFRYKL
jgi:hypothetical protein